MTDLDKWPEPTDELAHGQLHPVFGYEIERVRPDRPHEVPPLTEQEVKNLLMLAQVFDRRKADPTYLMEWTEVARRGRWTFDEAAEAVKKFYADFPFGASASFAKAGHINALIKDARAAREQPDPNEKRGPLSPRVAAFFRQYVPKFGGVVSDDSVEHPRGFHVRCQECRRPRLQPCKHPTRARVSPTFVHRVRMDDEREYVRRVAAGEDVGDLVR